MLLVLSVVLSSINKDTYAQAPEVNHTWKGSEIDTAEDSSTDGLSSEEVGDQPMNIDDAMQDEPSTDSLGYNNDVERTQLKETGQVQVNEKGNTQFCNEKIIQFRC